MALKVLNITEEGRGGGPLKRIKDVAHTLLDQDVETTVLFPNKNSEDFKESLDKLNVPYIETSMHRLTKAKLPLLMYVLTFIPEVLKLIRIIKKNNFDIVLCNSSWQIKGVLASRFTKAKSIWIQNDSYQPNAVKKLFNFAAKKADAFVFVSNRTKDFYASINQNILDKPNIVIQSPVDTNKFSPKRKKENIQDIELEGLNILSVGYINHNKGFDTLIRAIHEVNKQSENKINFYIAGPAFDSQQDYYKMLLDLQEELSVENLKFLGMRKDIPALLNTIDIYVCSSDFEASPISVWEALATELPVVATNVGDVEDIFKENKCGLVVPSKNPKKLAESILTLTKDEDLRIQLSKQARTSALELFSVQSVASKYKSFYKQVTS